MDGSRPRRLDDGATTGAGHRHPAHQTARRRRRRAPARAHRGVPRRIRRGRTGLRTGVRLRPRTRRVDAGRRRRPLRRRLRRRANPAAEHRPVDRHRRQLRPRPPRAGQGRAGLLRPVLGRRSHLPHRRRRRRRTHRGDRPVLAQLARPGAHPRPPATAPARAISAHDQGPDLHAHRRHRRRADHLTARNTRRRTQLGLPVHVDARQHLHPAGTALPPPGLGGRRVHAVRRRRRTVEDGSLQIMYGIDGRRDLTETTRDELSGYRAPTRFGSGTARSTSARTTSSGRYSTPSSCTPAAADTCPDACGPSCGPRQRAPPRPGVSRTRESGKPAGNPNTTCRRN